MHACTCLGNRPVTAQVRRKSRNISSNWVSWNLFVDIGMALRSSTLPLPPTFRDHSSDPPHPTSDGQRRLVTVAIFITLIAAPPTIRILIHTASETHCPIGAHHPPSLLPKPLMKIYSATCSWHMKCCFVTLSLASNRRNSHLPLLTVTSGCCITWPLEQPTRPIFLCSSPLPNEACTHCEN